MSRAVPRYFHFSSRPCPLSTQAAERLRPPLAKPSITHPVPCSCDSVTIDGHWERQASLPDIIPLQASAACSQDVHTSHKAILYLHCLLLPPSNHGMVEGRSGVGLRTFYLIACITPPTTTQPRHIPRQWSCQAAVPPLASVLSTTLAARTTMPALLATGYSCCQVPRQRDSGAGDVQRGAQGQGGVAHGCGRGPQHPYLHWRPGGPCFVSHLLLVAGSANGGLAELDLPGRRVSLLATLPLGPLSLRQGSPPCTLVSPQAPALLATAPSAEGLE